ncbi:hypothetical protein SBRY_10967 [Actinacidiphila bryophytorum]|uniref:Uncharacterized protein n=1 Tax=Actinacidiphila bryophytorum TaxID=1436133 RepID=A0A9W4GXY4_9ACTN|nr:hypothetical protein SBRY_10967 [Actinacidiphila bryophytorum]
MASCKDEDPPRSAAHRPHRPLGRHGRSPDRAGHGVYARRLRHRDRAKRHLRRPRTGHRRGAGRQSEHHRRRRPP